MRRIWTFNKKTTGSGVVASPRSRVRMAERIPVDKLGQLIFFHTFVKPFVWTFTGAVVQGRSHLTHDEPVIIVSNHNSHLDTVMLLHLVGGLRMTRVRPVAAADYFCRGKVMEFLTTSLFNILPIGRRGRDTLHSVDCMTAAIERGESLIIFPEGTRGDPEQLAPFHSGVGHLIAANPKVPVIPVYMHGLGRVMPKGHWLPVPHDVHVEVAPARCYIGTPKEITTELSAEIQQLRERTELEFAPVSTAG